MLPRRVAAPPAAHSAVAHLSFAAGGSGRHGVAAPGHAATTRSSAARAASTCAAISADPCAAAGGLRGLPEASGAMGHEGD